MRGIFFDGEDVVCGVSEACRFKFRRGGSRSLLAEKRGSLVLSWCCWFSDTNEAVKCGASEGCAGDVNDELWDNSAVGMGGGIRGVRCNHRIQISELGKHPEAHLMRRVQTIYAVESWLRSATSMLPRVSRSQVGLLGPRARWLLLAIPSSVERFDSEVFDDDISRLLQW